MSEQDMVRDLDLTVVRDRASSLAREREIDLALLRRFEPVIRYTRGEKFFPMRVEPYLRRSSLWAQRPGREPVALLGEGQVSPVSLAQPRPAPFGTIYFLKFITPMNLTQLAAYRLQTLQEGLRRRDIGAVFRAGRGRLARVGYTSRFVDAMFQLSLLARGRVPGDTAAAAALEYQMIMEERPHYSYYGRVVDQGDWTVLQYWFFYAFNNWRSGFYGANDHEADWEVINIYLAPAVGNGELAPQWVAYSWHDGEGSDLRRHWQDPEVEKVGEHPVIYAGAGSHASYYQPGEYLAQLELPFLAPLTRLSERLEQFWLRTLRRYPDEGEEAEPPSNIFRIPFVDYARGDGVSIGPGQEREWDRPALLNPVPGWALHYRGLWGLYARDPFSGEDAPAGPVYNRDGTVRRSWYDPVGWAGLATVPPPAQALALVLARQETVEERQEELLDEIAEESRRLNGLGVEAQAMRTLPHLRVLYAQHQHRIAALAARLDELRASYAEDAALLEALKLYAERLRAGKPRDLRAHIKHPHRPFSDVVLRFDRFAEVWAAVSISVGLLTFVILFLFAPQFLIWGLVLLVSVFVFVEASFRRQLPRLVTTVTVLLAVVASLVLLYEFFWETIVALVITAGAYLMWGNLRELWS
ncbi:MAG: hypothetical protein R3272_08745 [Candidatus Promineifilaceae bacterium]|nr:hypothetical protein [Candidatus Promineifilaceae bacterium]